MNSKLLNNRFYFYSKLVRHLSLSSLFFSLSLAFILVSFSEASCIPHISEVTGGVSIGTDGASVSIGCTVVNDQPPLSIPASTTDARLLDASQTLQNIWKEKCGEKLLQIKNNPHLSDSDRPFKLNSELEACDRFTKILKKLDSSIVKNAGSGSKLLLI